MLFGWRQRLPGVILNYYWCVVDPGQPFDAACINSERFAGPLNTLLFARWPASSPRVFSRYDLMAARPVIC